MHGEHTIATARRPRRRWLSLLTTIGWTLMIGVLALLFWALAVDGDGRSGLRHVVHRVCEPATRLFGTPFPCRAVSLDGGWAVVPAPFERSHLLIVPLRRLTGVEDPALHAVGAPDLWGVAWSERGRVAAALGRPLPDDALGLAINSESARTQSQYHIHLDCLAEPVRRRLAAEADAIGTTWRTLRFEGRRSAYLVRRLSPAALASEAAETIVDRELGPRPTVRSDLSIAVLGAPPTADGAPSLVLAVTWGLGRVEGGHAEELLDHHCRGI